MFRFLFELLFHFKNHLCAWASSCACVSACPFVCLLSVTNFLFIYFCFFYFNHHFWSNQILLMICCVKYIFCTWQFWVPLENNFWSKKKDARSFLISLELLYRYVLPFYSSSNLNTVFNLVISNKWSTYILLFLLLNCDILTKSVWMPDLIMVLSLLTASTLTQPNSSCSVIHL